MGLGGVAIAVLPSMIYPKQPFSDGLGGVQTFMWMCEDNIVEVPFDKEHLLEQILSPANLNRAYKAVMRNRGCGGIDRLLLETDEWLRRRIRMCI